MGRNQKGATMLDDKIMARLAEEAGRSRFNSYSPYSGFRVGAAALSSSGHIYTGANVENASYGLTVCAERVAIGNMISAGAKGLSAIAICADRPYLTPCGACRQVIYEFGPEAFIILLGDGWPRIMKIQKLLPEQFELEKIYVDNDK